MSITIPRGTKIYLTRKQPGSRATVTGSELSLKIDRHLPNDILYVLYDVKIGPVVIIPKGTAVLGDWITETVPCPAAQLQLSKIFINGERRDILADSDIFHTITTYNINEVMDANVVQSALIYHSTANITRRIVNVKCRTKVLEEGEPDLHILYMNINTREIPVVLLEDFIV
jgi:hypothetical protein